MDPDFAGAYDKGAKTEWLLEDMRLTGMHEGEAIGISKGKIEIAKNMLKENLDTAIISKITGLSKEEIESLLYAAKCCEFKKIQFIIEKYHYL